MIFNLSSLLDDLGEDGVTTLFSGYRAAKDSSVDEFLMDKAVMMEKKQELNPRQSKSAVKTPSDIQKPKKECTDLSGFHHLTLTENAKQVLLQLRFHR